MEYRKVQCREHGGTFQIPVKRGRPPTKCNETNVCTMVAGTSKQRSKSPAAKARAAIAEYAAPKASGGRRPAKVAAADSKPRPTLRGVNRSALRTTAWCHCDEQGGERHEKGIEGCKYATRGAKAVVRNNPSIPIARELKEQLEPLGWTCHAKGYFTDSDGIGVVDFSATRDTETITVEIIGGKAIKQHYSIWNDERPALNKKPASKLPFDPEEMSDAELAGELAGKRVVWWNPLGNTREYGRLPESEGKKITIQHVITMDEGNPDELPGSRIVTFVDQDGTGFRSFKVGALMAVKG